MPNNRCTYFQNEFKKRQLTNRIQNRIIDLSDIIIYYHTGNYYIIKIMQFRFISRFGSLISVLIIKYI